jgi:hypothetical protein
MMDVASAVTITAGNTITPSMQAMSLVAVSTSETALHSLPGTEKNSVSSGLCSE